MIGLNKIYIKLYYRFWYFMLPQKNVTIPDSLKTSRNIFIYFDYEREFGGHSTSISDGDINHIIALLGEQSIKSTWFTVGQIFKKYPETITAIIKNGHELASHTFNHTPPLHTSTKMLKNDFEQVEKFAPTKIMGFHSPNGRWSLASIKFLKKYNYSYDVISIPKSKNFTPIIQIVPFVGQIVRLQTVGDDWALYKKSNSADDVFNHFKKQLSKIKTGEIAGIGFHPWVLFSDNEILKGFSMFLKYLSEQKDVNIDTGIGYVNKINQTN